MQPHCSNCGAESGAPVSAASRKAHRLPPMRRILLFAFLLLLIFAVRQLLRPHSSWAEETACAKIKSVVYNTYGEIPECTAQILAKSGKRRYLVAVRYHLPNLDWRGSHVCLVFGVDADTSYVERMTTELSYDYDYEQHLDELKALWDLQ